MSKNRYTGFIRNALQEAVTAIRNVDDLQPEGKGKVGDFVTRADLASQEAILDLLVSDLPGCKVLLEEGESDVTAANFDQHALVAVIDPIDGTANFMRGLPHAISLALYSHGNCVEAGVWDSQKRQGGGIWMLDMRGLINDTRIYRRSPTREIKDSIVGTSWAYGDTPKETVEVLGRLAGETTVRMMGSAVQDWLMVATGQFGYYIHNSMKPFDNASGMPMARAMGLTVHNWEGKEAIIFDSHVIVAPAKKMDEFRKLALGN
ncbi:MAG TPA: inositol monophosphatase family protein [Candidatus Paceibacterota bacterium]